MTRKEFRDIAIRHQLYLERLKAGAVQKFNGYLKQWDTLIRTNLQKTGLDSLAQATAKRLDSILASLQKQQGELFSAAIDGLTKEFPALAKYEAEHERRVIQSVASVQQHKEIGVPSAKTVAKEVFARPVQAIGSKLDDFVGDWSKSAIRRTEQGVRIAYAQGLTVQQTVKKLVGTQELQLKDGLGTITKRQAQTVVRTAIQHVASTARQVTYEENEDVIVGYEWVSTLDGSTSTICRSLDGRKFKLGLGPLPPIHPNCRSTTVPTLGDAFDFLGKGATRSALNGPIDQNLTYYDWLKDQSEDFQKSVLGAQRTQLFRKGGLTPKQFADLNLDKNFEPLTLEQMRKLEPLAFNKAFGIPLEKVSVSNEKQTNAIDIALSKLNSAETPKTGPFGHAFAQTELDKLVTNPFFKLDERDSRWELGEQLRQIVKKEQTEIPLSKILSSQSSVTRSGVESYIQNFQPKADDLPVVIKIKNELILVDGNHRANAAYYLGHKSLLVDLIDGDKNLKVK